MGLITLRTNEDEDKMIDELDFQLRRLDLGVKDRSKVIKEGLRIALYYIKNSPFYKKECNTEASKFQSTTQEKVFIKQIQGSEMDLDGNVKR